MTSLPVSEIDDVTSGFRGSPDDLFVTSLPVPEIPDNFPEILDSFPEIRRQLSGNFRRLSGNPPTIFFGVGMGRVIMTQYFRSNIFNSNNTSKKSAGLVRDLNP